MTQPAAHGTERDALKDAVEAINAGNYTTAAQILTQLESSTSDPEVLRHLAFALYKTNREQEAELKLVEYRRRMRARGTGQ